ncbi:hypothetical protein [Methylobacterium longum]|uniref:DUF551 domain-containing protein n=2 Tax=Methylobacterium TaxID=407 RepID=A0ABT8AJB1_9HYPH|nr:hypothetical protein [Methylobacterium longum]MCJ2097650.1 hypothetical protein [Methylobacterium sp. E-046]MDN3569957.1 hypothetical protein [Methylobacterium longum]
MAMAGGWETMETAPVEEGSRVLLFDGTDQFVGVLTRYNTKHTGEWRLWAGAKPVPWDGGIPTHWMPLPDAPPG